MANSQATLVYTAQTGTSQAPAQIAALLASVPYPNAVMKKLGVELVSDTNAPGPPVTRTLVMRFSNTLDAAATATLFPGGEGFGGEIETLVLTAGGTDYPGRPAVRFVGGNPSMVATADCTMSVHAVRIPGGGGGNLYTAPVLTFVGGLARGGGGRQAQGTVTFVPGGAVTGIVMTDAGAGYVELPDAVITDPTGSGAITIVSMQVDAVRLIDGGKGYEAAPSVVFVPSFKVTWPDTGPQAQPFFNMMTSGLRAALSGPVIETAPVIA